MKKGIRKTISVIAILTMTFQMGMPMVPGLTSKVFATNTTIPVAEEKLQLVQMASRRLAQYKFACAKLALRISQLDKSHI